MQEEHGLCVNYNELLECRVGPQWALSTSSGFEHLHTAGFLLSDVYFREVVMFCGVLWRSL